MTLTLLDDINMTSILRKALSVGCQRMSRAHEFHNSGTMAKSRLGPDPEGSRDRTGGAKQSGRAHQRSSARGTLETTPSHVATQTGNRYDTPNPVLCACFSGARRVDNNRTAGLLHLVAICRSRPLPPRLRHRR